MSGPVLHASRRERVRREASPLAFEDIRVEIPEGIRAGSGDPLPDTHICARRYGPRDAPAILVLGGISSGRVLAGEHGWWPALIGPSRAIDTDAYAVYGLDYSPLADQRVAITPRVQARLIETVLDALGLPAFEILIGASYGGAVGLAFAALAPHRVRRLCVISAAHRPAPLALAWRGVQRRIVEFALEHGQGGEGLSLARQLAMITYRSADEFALRFHRVLGRDGRSDLDRYLVARGGAFQNAMAPRRWLSLCEALDHAVVAPQAIRAPTTLIACHADQLVPVTDIEALARELPNLARLHVFDSIYGHDAFLKETALMSDFLKPILEDADART